MDAGCLPAGGHLVAVNDLISDLYLTVGEGGQHSDDAFSELLTSEHLVGGVVTGKVASEEFVDGLDISACHDFYKSATHHSAVVLVHNLPPVGAHSKVVVTNVVASDRGAMLRKRHSTGVFGVEVGPCRLSRLVEDVEFSGAGNGLGT